MVAAKILYEKRALASAKAFRKAPTDAERKLWLQLRGNRLGLHFRRQVPIGSYIVDFVCWKIRLAIEVDGSEHVTDPETIERDARKEEELRANGLTTLRFNNLDVLRNVDGVARRILEFVETQR
ncbi:MAG TPA: DUF559 domain-containing protein [Candidatus Kryptonia bacterium]